MKQSSDTRTTAPPQRSVSPPQDTSSDNDIQAYLPQFEIMRMQSMIGNRATQRLVQGRLQRVVMTDADELKAARIKHLAAQLNNGKDKAALVKAVEDGIKLRSTDRRLANSCEWVKAGKAKLYAATSTEDSDDRIAEAGMNPAADLALFPNGMNGGEDHVFGNIKPAYKFDDLADNTGVDLDEDGKVTGGWNVPGKIAIYNARSVATDTVWSTLRHEVQHDADHNQDKRVGATPMTVNFERYKTEYRAYNYQQEGYENLSMTTNVNKYGYTWKERQLAIFEHIHGGYTHTQAFWDDSDPGLNSTPSTKGAPNDDTISDLAKAEIETRQAQLVAYVNPDTEGYNKWNSVRVEDFYVALKAVPNGTTDDKHASIVELLKKCAPLKLEDKRYVRAESPDYQTMLTTKLAGAAKTAVYAAIGKK